MLDIKGLTIDQLGQLQEETILEADKLIKAGSQAQGDFLMVTAVLLGELIASKNRILELEKSLNPEKPESPLIVSESAH